MTTPDTYSERVLPPAEARTPSAIESDPGIVQRWREHFRFRSEPGRLRGRPG